MLPNLIAGGIASVVQNVGSFVSRGAAAIGSVSSSVYASSIAALNKTIINVSSWSSVTASTFRTRFNKMMSERASYIRSINPRASIKSYSARSQTPKSVEGGIAGEGFYEMAEVLDTLADSLASVISIEATRSAENMRTKLMQYPAQLPNSSYIRTFQLQQGWQTAMVSFDISSSFSLDDVSSVTNAAASVSLGNNVPYAKWVQRRATQLPVHRGRWNTVEDVAEQELPELTSRVQAFLDELIDMN